MLNLTGTTDGVEKQNKKGNEWLFVNPYLVVGVVGASLCFGWMYSILLMPGYPGIDALGPHASQLFRLAFALSLTVFYLLTSLLAGILQSHRGAAVAITLIAALGCSVPVPFEVSGTAAYVLFAVRAVGAGLGVSMLTTLWVEFLCAHLKQTVRQAVSTMFVLALLWYLGMLISDPRFFSFEQLGAAILSCGVYLVLKQRYAPMDTMPLIDVRESDARYPITWQPSLLTIMGSLAEGFALYWLLAPADHAQINAYLVDLIALVVCAMVLVDSLNRFLVRERTIRRLFLPVLAACILTELFLPRNLLFVPCLLAWAFSILPYLSALFATCEHIVRCRLSAFRAFAKARIFASFGLAAGLAIGWLAFETDLFGDVNLQVWAFIVVMFFIVVSTSVPLESFYPGDEPLYNGTVRINVNGEMVSSDELPDLVDGTRYFKDRCDAVAARFGLTARQTEVLYLLAKGRNASYIQEKLVISPHTVKAHIYTIYKKTDQHSQQDLMDLVEGFEIDGRKGGAE